MILTTGANYSLKHCCTGNIYGSNVNNNNNEVLSNSRSIKNRSVYRSRETYRSLYIGDHQIERHYPRLMEA